MDSDIRAVFEMANLVAQGSLSLAAEFIVLQKQLRTLQGVVGSLQQDVARLEECVGGLVSKSILHTVREQGKEIESLEEKFALMEKVLNIEVLPHMHELCNDDIPDGEAERADFERWMEDERATL